MTTTDTLIISYLTGHDHATFNDLYHHTQHPASDVGEAINRLEQRRIITRTTSRVVGHDTWTLTTPDTPATPTPPTIAAMAALVDGWESYEWQIPCPTIVDKAFANGYEAATSDRARELRGALLGQQSADKDLGGTCGAPRTELRQPSLDVAKAVVDELEARMRDRLRAWGLQCEDDSSSDQETQP